MGAKAYSYPAFQVFLYCDVVKNKSIQTQGGFEVSQQMTEDLMFV